MTLSRRKISIHCAGIISLLCYVWLAKESRTDESVPLSLFLPLLAAPWICVLVIWFWGEKSTRYRSIIFWAILFRLVGCWATPIYEDDYYRFLWDGYKFSETGDPYTGTPLEAFSDPDVPPEIVDVLDYVNHPHLPTLYGPPMEFTFLINHWLWPASLVGLKVLFLLFEAGMLFALSRMIPRKTFLLAAWCPLLIFETSFQAHPDIIGVTFLTLGILAIRSKKPFCSMLGQAAAMASKIFAILTWPFLLTKDKWFLQGILASAVAAAFYLPFLLQGSNAGLISTKAMATDWEFNSAVYGFVKIWLSPNEARLTCLSLFALIYFGIVGWYLRKKFNNQEVEAPLDIVYGMFFLLSPVVNSWYLLWLFPFVMLKPRCWSITALMVVSLSYVTGLNLNDPELRNFENPLIIKIVEFGAILAAAGIDIIRHRKRLD